MTEEICVTRAFSFQSREAAHFTR